jgi:uncharacterized phage protein (TIGR02218 family)
MSEEWLAGPLTTAVYGWRLERRDGVTLGFTSHDHDIMLDGLLHRSSPGMQPTSITESLGLETDGLDVRGAMDSTAISETDLRAGRWDGARVSIYHFDWTQPDVGKRLLASGELGEVDFSGTSFQAELRGLTALLDAEVSVRTSPGCRAVFCDAACGLNQQRFRRELLVQNYIGDQIFIQSPTSIGINQFAYGTLRWLDGANCGLISEVISNNSNSLILSRSPAYLPISGARISVIEGCDKTVTTCAVRYANAVNFRGEPHLPGNDLLTRYPGAN